MRGSLTLLLACSLVVVAAGCGRDTTRADDSLVGAWQGATSDVSLRFIGDDHSGVLAIGERLESASPAGCRDVLTSSGSYVVSQGALTARMPMGVLTQSECDDPNDDLVVPMPGFASYESAPLIVTSTTLTIHTSTGDEVYVRAAGDAGVSVGDAGPR